MTTKKSTATKADTPDNSPTQVGEIIKSKNGKSVNKPKILNCPKCNRAYKKQDSLDKHVESCDGSKGGAGGWQGAGGRPKGSENEKTKELKAIKQGMQMTIAGKVNMLVAAQIAQAVGNPRLWMREKREYEVTSPKGKVTKKHQWISRMAIGEDDYRMYLSLDHDANGNAKDKDLGVEFYYEHGAGNHQALANLLDRAFGKPKENLELGEDPDAPLPVHGTGTTTELRKALVAMVKQQIKEGSK